MQGNYQTIFELGLRSYCRKRICSLQNHNHEGRGCPCCAVDPSWYDILLFGL